MCGALPEWSPLYTCVCTEGCGNSSCPCGGGGARGKRVLCYVWHNLVIEQFAMCIVC